MDTYKKIHILKKCFRALKCNRFHQKENIKGKHFKC